MKLAILGADDDSLNLIYWAIGQNGAGQGGYELVAAYDSDPFAERLRALSPHIRLDQSWEELAVASAADAVIIGRGGKYLTAETGIDHAERRADQLRKLVQAAVPMIVVCPACEAIVGFEIEMIRRDTKGVIVPFVPDEGRLACATDDAFRVTTAGMKVMKIEQLSLEREQTDRSREAVLTRFARDMTLLGQLMGEIQTVSASGPPRAVGRDPLGPKPKELPSLSNLNVNVGNANGLSARWSMAPPSDEDLGRLTIVGEKWKAIVMMPTRSEWSLTIGNEVSATGLSNEFDFQAVMDRLVDGIMGSEMYVDAAWLAACRDQEAAEAVDRSLARGRTIELFNEQLTEEDSFKGIMAMGGCFLLLMALGVVVFAAIVEGLQLPIREWRIWQPWPFYLLIPIAVFLLLQFLQLAIKRDAR